jgi:hypothetical protein
MAGFPGDSEVEVNIQHAKVQMVSKSPFMLLSSKPVLHRCRDQRFFIAIVAA